ncbi:MAG: HAD-IA family hydrolase [Selenomonadaceae bacterium]|nr:HAD-IA family hydrolase [Selenomonadaceae bacterium]
MKIFRAAIFDMDGTLTDTLADLHYSMNETLAHYNFPQLSFEQVKQYVGNGARKFLQRSLPYEIPDENFFDEAFKFYNESYISNCLRNVKPYAGVMEMLTTLEAKKIPLAVCTNKQHVAAVSIAEKILAPIKFVAVSGDEPCQPRKPDPTRALDIAKKMGVAPDEVAYLGDTSVDIETAINAGFLPVGVSWGFRPRTELFNAKIIIDHPRELMELVNFG